MQNCLSLHLMWKCVCEVQTEENEVELLVDNPLLWNAEEPNLYRLAIKTAGEVIVQGLWVSANVISRMAG